MKLIKRNISTDTYVIKFLTTEIIWNILFHLAKYSKINTIIDIFPQQVVLIISKELEKDIY